MKSLLSYALSQLGEWGFLLLKLVVYKQIGGMIGFSINRGESKKREFFYMALAQITEGSVVKLSDINAIINAVNASSGFPSGTKMLFNQSAAPTGWTKQTSVNDATLRVVSGTTGGGTGGSIAFSTLFATGKTVSLSGNVGATTLTVAQMPSHTHKVNLGVNVSEGTTPMSYEITNKGTVTSTSSTTTTGSSSSHTHSLSGSAQIALNVKYTDVIICAKA